MQPDIVKKWNRLREIVKYAGAVVSTINNDETQKFFDDAVNEWIQFEKKHGLNHEMMVKNVYKEPKCLTDTDQKPVFDCNLSDTQSQYHCRCGRYFVVTHDLGKWNNNDAPNYCSNCGQKFSWEKSLSVSERILRDTEESRNYYPALCPGETISFSVCSGNLEHADDLEADFDILEVEVVKEWLYQLIRDTEEFQSDADVNKFLFEEYTSDDSIFWYEKAIECNKLVNIRFF